MSKVSEGNYEIHSVKRVSGKILVRVTETRNIAKDVPSKKSGNWECKDDPHPDFDKAFDALNDIVKYDEGYTDSTDFKVTGINFHGPDKVQITHVKEKESGSAATNSGKIPRDSEEFEKVEELFAICEKIKHEAYEYFVNYKRAQLSLLDSEDKNAA